MKFGQRTKLSSPQQRRRKRRRDTDTVAHRALQITIYDPASRFPAPDNIPFPSPLYTTICTFPSLSLPLIVPQNPQTPLPNQAPYPANPTTTPTVPKNPTGLPIPVCGFSPPSTSNPISTCNTLATVNTPNAVIKTFRLPPLSSTNPANSKARGTFSVKLDWQRVAVKSGSEEF